MLTNQRIRKAPDELASTVGPLGSEDLGLFQCLPLLLWRVSGLGQGLRVIGDLSGVLQERLK